MKILMKKYKSAFVHFKVKFKIGNFILEKILHPHPPPPKKNPLSKVRGSKSEYRNGPQQTL